MINEDQQGRLDALVARIPMVPIYSKPGTSFTGVEDGIVKILAGEKTAEDIGAIIGRSRQGVTRRISVLGLDGRLKGENHAGAKLSNTQVQILHALHDAGFNVSEIHKCCFSHMSYDGVLTAFNQRGK